MRSSERSAFRAESVLPFIDSAWPSVALGAQVGSSENFVFESNQGSAFVRITPNSRRTRDEVEGELEVVDYLYRRGVAVAPSIPSGDGRSVVTFDTSHGEYHVAVFKRAPGVQVQWGDTPHNLRLLRDRGRALAVLHNYLESFEFEGGARPHWDQERPYQYLRDPALKLPDGIRESWRELEEWTSTLTRCDSEFGVIHGDFGSPNYRQEGNVLTAFDFDDSVLAWFDLDLAISLWPTGLMPQAIRFQFRDALFEAYGNLRKLPAGSFERLQMFCQLRTLFLWANWESSTPRDQRSSKEQQRQDRLLESVANPFSWVRPSQ